MHRPYLIVLTIVPSLLQNVGAVHQSPFIRPMNSLLLHWSPFTTSSEFTQNPVHQSPFIRPMNSLLFHWSPFTTTSEFTQNLVKSLDVQGHLLLQCFSILHEDLQNFVNKTSIISNFNVIFVNVNHFSVTELQATDRTQEEKV